MIAADLFSVVIPELGLMLMNCCCCSIFVKNSIVAQALDMFSKQQLVEPDDVAYFELHCSNQELPVAIYLVLFSLC